MISVVLEISVLALVMILLGPLFLGPTRGPPLLDGPRGLGPGPGAGLGLGLIAFPLAMATANELPTELLLPSVMAMAKLLVVLNGPAILTVPLLPLAIVTAQLVVVSMVAAPLSPAVIIPIPDGLNALLIPMLDREAEVPTETIAILGLGLGLGAGCLLLA